MRTILFATAIVVGLLVISIGIVPALWSYMNYVRSEAGARVTGCLSDDWVVKEAREKLEQKKQELREYFTVVYRVKADISKFEKLLKDSKSDLANKEQILKSLNELLKKNPSGSTITAGGVQYDRESVEQDALSYVSSCEVLRNQIAGNEQALSTLRQSYDDGKKAISDADNDLRQLEAQLGMDAVTLAIASAQREARMIASQVYLAGKGISTAKSSVYSEEFVRRLNEAGADNEWSRLYGAGRSPRTNWGKEFGLAEKTTSKIDSYFKSGSSATCAE